MLFDLSLRTKHKLCNLYDLVSSDGDQIVIPYCNREEADSVKEKIQEQSEKYSYIDQAYFKTDAMQKKHDDMKRFCQ